MQKNQPKPERVLRGHKNGTNTKHKIKCYENKEFLLQNESHWERGWRVWVYHNNDHKVTLWPWGGRRHWAAFQQAPPLLSPLPAFQMDHDLFYTASVTLQSLQKPYCGLKPLVDLLFSHGAALPVTHPVPCLGAQLKEFLPSSSVNAKALAGLLGPCDSVGPLPFCSGRSSPQHWWLLPARPSQTQCDLTLDWIQKDCLAWIQRQLRKWSKSNPVKEKRI